MNGAQADARLRVALESAPSGVVMVDREGTIVLVNREVERLFGYTREELLGQTVEMLVPGAHRQGHAGFRAGFNRHPQARAMGAGRDLRGRRKDGTEVPVEIGLNPIETDEGLFVLASVVDISRRKQAEDELRRLTDELEQRVVERTAQLEATNRELETFTYSVSHDLRAPLRHVEGFIQLLAEELGERLDAQAARYVRRVREGVAQMGRLINDLLNLARLGRQTVTRQPTDLGVMVRDVISTMDVGGRRIQWSVAEDLPTLACDPGLTQVALTNLLANAVKYTRPRDQARIEVGETERDGRRWLFVKDNGVGFDPQQADKLFGVFQRLHTAEEFEGTGVGLATVQRIVHKHGGRIWAEAAPDQGATFYFTLGSA